MTMTSLLSILEVLKNTQRRGWVIRSVPEPESVADHMYRMAMICLAYPWADESDRDKAIEMAIVHDAPEAIAGDITPSDGIGRETKYLREKLGLDFLVCLAREFDGAFADRIENLWKEYEERRTPISEVVHQVDKFEALQQARIYAARYPDLDLTDFKSLRREITDPWLEHQADEVLREWDAADSRRKSAMPVVFVIGGPGVGKGTQCVLAAEEFGFEHISVGDLLRIEQGSPGSVFKDFISQSIRFSVAVPATLAMMLLESKLEDAQAKGKVGILLDGFPRSVEQLRAYEEQVSNPYSTIVMDCPDITLSQRLTSRAISSDREDDSSGLIERRVKTFRSSIKELCQHLSKNELQTIDCVGPIEEVQRSFKHSMHDIIRKTNQAS